jgi:transposase
MKNDTGIVASVGIDLGDRFAYYVCLNEAGEVTDRGQVGMTISAMKRHWASVASTRIAIEAGAQSRWVSRVLRELGHEVIVANPRQVKLISASQSKSDPNDAMLLARLARVDPMLLAPVEHRSDAEQVDLTIIRARALLVEERVKLMHAVGGMAKAFGIRLPRGTSERYIDRAMQALPGPLAQALAGLFGAMLAITEQIEAYDRMIEEAARRYPATERLREVPGVGTLTALSFQLTIGEAGRFEHSRDVGSYLGLRPRQQQSGARDPQLGITKAGDRYTRTLVVQSAHCVLRKYAPDTALKRWGLKLCERGGKNAKKRAVVAVARKLAVVLHRLWVSGERYVAFPVTQPTGV